MDGIVTEKPYFQVFFLLSIGETIDSGSTLTLLYR